MSNHHEMTATMGYRPTPNFQPLTLPTGYKMSGLLPYT